MRLLVFLSLAIVAAPLAAQTPPPMGRARIYHIGRGLYEGMNRGQFSPGQVVTLFVHGAGVNLREEVFAPRTGPLPTNLAGISVDLQSGGYTIPVPIFAIRPEIVCEPGVCALRLPSSSRSRTAAVSL